MTTYLASPSSQMQASLLTDMPVLLSFGCYSPFMDHYQQSFDRVLIDSGAFSVMNSGKSVDLAEYIDWGERWRGRADAIAGLDSIEGDWRQSMKNYEACDWHFPTYHDSDPVELLDDLVAMARERCGWLGVGLVPPRQGKERWIDETCGRLADAKDLHVHGWALRWYRDRGRFDSLDSTNWYRDAMKIRVACPWLTYAECMGLMVTKYKRETRQLVAASGDATLFEMEG